MRLRPPRVQDIDALARLGSESFVAKFGHIYRPEDLACHLESVFSPAAIAAELANPLRRYAVAEEDGALHGYCRIALDCGFPEHARGHRTMELKQLYTAPDRTGHGIGTLLMDWAMAEFAALGADEVQLSVWSLNPGAQRFYARYGFSRVADVHYRVGEQLDEEFLFARML